MVLEADNRMWMKLGISLMCAVIFIYFLSHSLISIRDPLFEYIAGVTIIVAAVIPLSGMVDTNFMNRNNTNKPSSRELDVDNIPQDNYTFNLKLLSRQRFAFLAIGMIVFLIANYAGAAFVKVNINEAKIIKRGFQAEFRGTHQYDIFIINSRGALEMFLPVFGIAYGAFSTGLVLNAYSHTSPLISHISPLLILFTPYGILELIAYGIAISRSGILSYQLVKDRNKSKSWQEYVIPAGVEVGIVLLVLLIASIIECTIDCR